MASRIIRRYRFSGKTHLHFTSVFPCPSQEISQVSHSTYHHQPASPLQPGSSRRGTFAGCCVTSCVSVSLAAASLASRCIRLLRRRRLSLLKQGYQQQQASATGMPMATPTKKPRMMRSFKSPMTASSRSCSSGEESRNMCSGGAAIVCLFVCSFGLTSNRILARADGFC